MSLKYWDNIYCSSKNIQEVEAIWLKKYFEIFKENVDKPIIELGCGSGTDSIFLLNSGFSIISCDFSSIVLDKLKTRDKRIFPMQFDLSKGLPFKDSEAHIIVASLSLHYFTWTRTVELISEINQVLDNAGYLLCRLNSVNDKNYGSRKGREIETNYYKLNGHCKRFFDKKSIQILFRDWNIHQIEEVKIIRYGQPKIAWEVLVQKS